MLATSALALALPRVNSQAPDWVLANAQGDFVSFYEDSEGQPSLLLLWTTACEQTCRSHFTQMQQQAQRAGVKTYLLLVSTHLPSAEPAELPDRPAPLFNAQAVGRFYGIHNLPSWVLIDHHKTIIQSGALNADSPSQLPPLLDALAP